MLDRGTQNQEIASAVDSNSITQPQINITQTLGPLMYNLDTVNDGNINLWYISIDSCCVEQTELKGSSMN